MRACVLAASHALCFAPQLRIIKELTEKSNQNVANILQNTGFYKKLSGQAGEV